jgi:glycosyltransferase involved in cell wall biosynthesis
VTARVDVLVAAHGGSHLLAKTLESVERQQLRDTRILVADDSSAPEVRTAIERLGDDRFSYVPNRSPLGPAGNHRRLLERATAPLVAILNHDDLWAPEFLARLVPPLEEDPETVVAFCDHEVVDARGERLAERTEECSRRYGRAGLRPGRHRPFDFLVERQAIALACAAVFRRSAIPAGEPPDEVGGAYDLWLAFRLAASNGGAFYAPERLASWRWHAASLGERRDLAGTLAIAACWRAIAGAGAAGSLARTARRRAAAAFRVAALQGAEPGSAAAARAAAASAWRLERSPRSAVALLAAGLLPAFRSFGERRARRARSAAEGGR